MALFVRKAGETTLMITIQNVTKEFKQDNQLVTALNDVSFKVGKNEFFGLVGESGSGKSTLLKLLNFLEKPTAGVITLLGKSTSHLKAKEAREMVQQTSMIFQQFNLLQNLTVKQNVSLALTVQGKNNEPLISEMLEFVGMLDYIEKYPSQLSGGQKQRVAIARALVTNPAILLCDEPTSALDSQNSFEVMKLLKKVQEEFDTTIIFVSHELELIKQWCDRAAIMEKGKLLDVIKVTKEAITNENKNYYEQVVDYLV